MKTVLKSLVTAGLGLFALTGIAEAQDRYSIPRPPVVLSPDLADPWVLQLQPRKRQATIADPVVRSAKRKKGYRTASRGTQKKNKPRYSRTLPKRFLPQVVSYYGGHKPGTLVIDTNDRYLYLVMKDGKARRYGVGVGKPGFEWAGSHRVTRKAEWPNWRPPAEMIAREKKKGRILPRFMPGGPENPMGARALYLGSTLYRIHGSNQPWTIGHAVSSGCIRMRNQDVTDLYERVPVGAKVVVL
ncbi:L,D-transpeptidase [Coralliovum pocilloporae]|uniref:L,D-transpeptidase n=1 Tax=Coralliovum pocilloporae TaxID=3066369 RepID=UPI003307BE37